MNNREFDILEQAVRVLHEGRVPEGPPADLAARTLERIEKARSQTRTNPLLERIRTMKPFAKFIAAAAVLAVVAALFLFNSSPSSVALADVYSRVQQAQAFLYRMTATIVTVNPVSNEPITQEMEGEMLISTEYGMRMDNHMTMPEQSQTMHQQMYILPREGRALMVMPEEKQYMRIEFTEDLFGRMRQQNNDPREIIKQMLSSKFEELGRSELDGVPVQGFRTTDAAYFGGAMGDGGGAVTLWVDADTWLPVRLDMDVTMGEMKMQATMHDYQWDVAVSPEDFNPALGEDYEEMANMKMPEMNEETAIAGLQKFHEIAGRYPEKLGLMELMQDIQKAMVANPEYQKRIREMKQDGGELDKAGVDMLLGEMMPVQGLGMFYMTLVQDQKDPAYYGGTVEPGDANSVLLRWQIEGDRYRVIFGDLSAGEMTYEGLKAVEPAAETAPTP